ncbi:BRE1 E3 ubiquitin ligase-domain-containing protein [Coprinopsis sp. MPI-PUGE-AT-0042]|nr:BRE1 E3 ubiquitin ligase-domain-containing protein [Coprinopsis sp. MPI-PUGE-AT-0042]
MESRKRPHMDDGDVSVAKKRVLTGSNGTPHVNAASDQTEDDQIFNAGLENFRKEAIYRRMKYYSRENDRNVARIKDLERRKTSCEAGVAAISACWSQLIETIRVLINADNLDAQDIQGKELFDIGSRLEEDSVPELKSAFGVAAKATEALVTKFVGLGGEHHSKYRRKDEHFDCQTECAALRSELQLTRKHLSECEQARDKYHDELVATQNRIERSQSQTVLAVESKAALGKTTNGDAEDTQRKPSSPSDSPESPPATASAAETPAPSSVSQEAIESRERRIAELERELYNERLKYKELEVKKEYLQVDQIISNPLYKAMEARFKLDHLSVMELSEENKRVQLAHNALVSGRKEWEEHITGELKKVVEELKAAIAKRDAENVRLREQRDQQIAEVNERKQKDSVKRASLNEWKNLAESRGERITILQSELRRTGARLSAQEGREDLMLFFLKGDGDVAKLVDTLKSEKEALEVRVKALEDLVTTMQQDQLDLPRYIDETATKLVQVSSELDKFRKVYGNLSSLPPDASELLAKVKALSEEAERLRLLNTQFEQSESSLYEELEKLSTAWENADKQLNNKVFDLSSMEERLQKSVVEKAKSDNKYFSAMREREALETERKNLQRVYDKAQTALDHFREVEKAVISREEGILSDYTHLKERRQHNINETIKLKQGKIDVMGEKLAEEKKVQGLKEKGEALFNQYESDARRCRAQADKYEAEMKKKAVEIQRLKEEAAARAVHKHGHGSSDNEENRHLRSLLMCSTCSNHFRSVVITKCMHTVYRLSDFDPTAKMSSLQPAVCAV